MTVIDHNTHSSDNSTSTIIWVVVENTTNVQLTVTTSNNSTAQTYQVGWGSIREVTSEGKVVKFLDPVAENWPRSIEANDTTVVITYSVNETRPPWQHQPISVALTTVLTLQNNSKSVAAAKFSLSIDGDWQFSKTSNKLEADFTMHASFRDIESCGKSTKYRLESNDKEEMYHFGSDQSNAVVLTILRGCVADGVHQDTSTLPPMFFNNDTAVNVTVRFPTFKMSLVYDPDFAVLLGYTGSWSCDPLLTWILLASFLGGAPIIIVVLAWCWRCPICQ